MRRKALTILHGNNYLKDRYEKQGIEHDVIRAGEFKARNLDGQMTERELKEMQESVNATHRQFIEHVLSHRHIDGQFMQGQCFEGKAALEINMLDGLFNNLTEFKQSFKMENPNE